MTHSWQQFWFKAKKMLKFVWRHFFTIFCIIAAIDAFTSSNPILSRVLITLGVAVAIDWVKQFIKLGRNIETPSSMNDPFDIGTPFHKRHWSNPDIIGSTTSILNTTNRIKYD